jgi:hypothetical protein
VAVGYTTKTKGSLCTIPGATAWARAQASPSSAGRKKALNQAQNGGPHDRMRIVIPKVRGGFSESSQARRGTAHAA